MSQEIREAIESGVPDAFPYMHPLMRKNYGQWDWHERPRPGVLHHVAVNGDEIWTVRAGTQRQMSWQSGSGVRTRMRAPSQASKSWPYRGCPTTLRAGPRWRR